MKQEVTLKQEDLLAAVEEKPISDLIRPLIHEIHLFDTIIAGTTYIEDKTLYEQLVHGEKLFLQRENNRFDERAILVLNREKKKLGYVPERDNEIFSRLMDAGKLLEGKVIAVDVTDGWYRVRIGIYLIDY